MSLRKRVHLPPDWPAPATSTARPTDHAHWSSAWAELGATQPPPDAYEQLLARYAEPHRAYHTRQHLDECLHFLALGRSLFAHPDEVALALWFHDAVYEPARTDNEARSADWLVSLAAEANVSSVVRQRLHALVMSTCHRVEANDPDARALLDIDLAILGAPATRFDEYEQQIRREYRHVPAAEYCIKRAHVLERFLARPAIYATASFRERFEQAARENIRRSIAALRSR